ncbi:lytic transglycosylase [Bordetella genomosp. 9]|uniref:lytic transglycosylase domain-containing protein n=1 Tax=Bordetella genomosp. 9 TaxID=1416803 RepID=UPI000A28E462|nr:transglycosylase SLT domain-containing protein [Bordetella genomosp. 9]ARP92179.1 lytic transglycosylase [Bordetella genomosp. 9]
MQCGESGRYQKSSGADAARLLRRCAPLLALLAVACAPVDAQQRTLPQNASAVPVSAGALQAQAGVGNSVPASAVVPIAAAALDPTLTAEPDEPAMAEQDPPTPARQAVMTAREAMLRKQWSALALTVPQARGDALGMYPEYWLLRYQVWNTPREQWPVAQMQRFIESNPDAYLADKLRADWLLSAARSGDYATVNRLAPVRNGNAQTECAALEARHMTGRRVTAREAMRAFAPGVWCWSLYDQLVADRVLGWKELQPELRNAIENNKVADAKRYAGYLFEPPQQKAFDALLKDPMKWLVRQPRPPRTQAETELVTIALARLARGDLDAGESYFSREWARSLPRQDAAWVRAQFALVAVLNLDPRAYDWYVQAGHIRLTEYNEEWKVRAALRQPRIDWKWVIDAIDAMTPQAREEPAWIYWRARGLAATGHREQAQREYERIAGQFNFYGQLAAEELGQAITVPPRPPAVTKQELAQARANAGLQRAIALFRLGWRSEAVAEWNFSLRNMDDRQLLAAAELARRANIYDRVVNTSERTEKQFDFTQRYIAPFEGRVAAKAAQVALDPAWVYGLIRQESRFIMDARSSVGASGLMQLMPGTAKWVANKIGLSGFNPSQVNDFDTNTLLGTSYLSMVLQDLDGSQLLASAGYNAGPRRPHRWRASLTHPVEGAIFAETIPFTETRTYVKNVMANATYYAAMFTGQPQSLKQRLGKVAPLGPEGTNLP